MHRFSFALTPLLGAVLLACSSPSALAQTLDSVQLDAEVVADETFKLGSRVPWAFTVNPRGTQDYPGGATWIVYVTGADIYGNIVYIQVARGTVPRIQRGDNYRVANQFWTIPNDGTLFNVEAGYEFVVALFDPPPTDLTALNNPVHVVRGRFKIDVIANLAVPSPAVIYPGPNQRQFFRGGDIVQFQAYWFNRARGEGTPNGRVQSRPLRPRDRYSVDLRLSSNPAFNIAAIPDEEGDGTEEPPIPEEDDQLPEVTDDVNDDFKLMRIFLAADLGPGFSPNGFSQIRRVEVTGTPLGTSAWPTAGALNPYGIPLSPGVGSIPNTARSYDPQPYDGFLDIGEQVSIVTEQLVPSNFVGRYFVGVRVAMTNPALDSALGNNVFVSNSAPKFEIVADSAPTIEAASVISTDNGVFVDGGRDASDYSSVSEFGQFIAFESAANNLQVPSNLAATIVAANGPGVNFADPATYPAEFAGQRVLFVDVQPYLTTGRQIFVKNRSTGEVLLVSRQADGGQANRDCLNPWISANGRYVAFQSTATNLTDDNTGGRSAIYVFDLETDSTVLVSINRNDIPANGNCFRPRLSASGRFVVFESEATNLDLSRNIPAGSPQQIYFHDRDADGNGVFDQPGSTATYLVSVNQSGTRFDQYNARPVINLNDSAADLEAQGGRMFVAFTSWAGNTSPAPSNGGYAMVYRASVNVTSPNLLARGAVPSQLLAVSLNPDGSLPVAVGYDPVGAFIRPDCDQAALNGDGSVIAFKTDATSLVLNSLTGNYTPTYPNNAPLQPFLPPVPGVVPDGDYNRVPDVFVRDLNGEIPGQPNVERVSVSNERVATGVITFGTVVGLGNVPNSQPVAGDFIAISDGVNSRTFTFGGNVAIGANVQATRDNLIRRINLEFAGSLLAEPTTPPNVLNAAGQPAPGLGYNASIYLKNVTPGPRGNVAISVNNPLLPGGTGPLRSYPLGPGGGAAGTIYGSGMSGGGRQAEDDALSPGNPNAAPVQGVPFGSGQPSLDRSGNLVVFRTIATNLDVYEETLDSIIPALPPFPGYPQQQVNLYPAQEKTLITGEAIRPLIFPTANVYLHDRQLDRTKRLSVSKFGYPTVIFGTQPGGVNANTSAANHSPAISASGRFISFSSDSTAEGGLIFGANNLSWPPNQRNVRNVFVHDRQLVGEIPPEADTRPQVQFLSPPGNLRLVPGSTVTVSASAVPAGSKTISSVRLTVNGAPEGAELTAVPYTWNVLLPNAGTYNLRLTATDNRGVEGVASLVLVVSLPQLPSNPAPGSNERFVIDYFRKIFFRVPTFEEYDMYLRMLEGGSSQAETIVAMMQSPEFASVQNVLFGYYLRMGLTPSSTNAVINQLFAMTNGTNGQLLTNSFLPMSGLAGLPPYGATLGQALVAQDLLNQVPPVGTNKAVRSMQNPAEFQAWMLRSFNEPYLPQANTNQTLALGDAGSIAVNIQNVPSATNSILSRYGHNYAYMSAFYASMPPSNISSNALRTALTNFNPKVQGIALNYLLAPGNPWATNSPPLSTNLAASLLPPVITNTGTNTLTRSVSFTNIIPVGGQNLLSNTAYTWSATNLPTNVTVSISNNPVRYFVRGTFTNIGTFPLTLIASNGPGLLGSNSIVYQVLPPRPIVPPLVIEGAVGEPLMYALASTVLNAPTSFSITPMPAGLTLHPSSGMLSGTPLDEGTSVSMFTASNAGGLGQGEVTFQIRPMSPMVQWFIENGLTGFNADRMADPDGDGHSNIVEFAFGMRPDLPDIIPFRYEFNGRAVTFYWTRRIATTEVHYEVLQTSTLNTPAWSAVENVLPSVVFPEPGMVLPRGYERVSATVNLPDGSPESFYRINAVLAPQATRASLR